VLNVNVFVKRWSDWAVAITVLWIVLAVLATLSQNLTTWIDMIPTTQGQVGGYHLFDWVFIIECNVASVFTMEVLS
jgi:hypothetical protein